jgi:hypothetical protein
MRAQRSDRALLKPRGWGGVIAPRTGLERAAALRRARMPGVRQARCNSLACDRARSASLPRGSLGQRACERPHHNSHGGSTDSGGSRAHSPLLASDAPASVYLRRSSGVQVAGWPQRSAIAPRGRRLLSSGAGGRGAHSTLAAAGEAGTPAAGEHGRRSAHRCRDKSAASVTRENAREAER